MRQNTQNIILTVDAEAAKVFNSASLIKRKKFEELFSQWLKKSKDSSETPSLLEMMDSLSASAAKKGLTKEKLRELLADD
jgi:hypothetical protein